MSEILKPAANIDEYLDALSAPTEEAKMRKAIAEFCHNHCGPIECMHVNCSLHPWKPGYGNPEKGVDNERPIV